MHLDFSLQQFLTCIFSLFQFSLQVMCSLFLLWPFCYNIALNLSFLAVLSMSCTLGGPWICHWSTPYFWNPGSALEC